MSFLPKQGKVEEGEPPYWGRNGRSETGTPISTGRALGVFSFSACFKPIAWQTNAVRGMWLDELNLT
jgi:hypothetical protein